MTSVERMTKRNRRLSWMVFALLAALALSATSAGIALYATFRVQSAFACLQELLTDRATLTAADNAANLAEGQAELDWHLAVTAVLTGGKNQPPKLYETFLTVNAHYNQVFTVSQATLSRDQEARQAKPLGAC